MKVQWLLTTYTPFFAPDPAHATLPAGFVKDFHDLGAQVGQAVLPGRGLVVLHRGGAENPVVFAMSTTYMAAVLALLLLLTFGAVHFWRRHGKRVQRRVRWDGGLRRLLPEMTYTATGFSNPIRVIFDTLFRPTVEDTNERVAGHFQLAIRRKRERVHLWDRLVLNPAEAAAMGCAAMLAKMHHGRLNVYATYTLLVLLVALTAFL